MFYKSNNSTALHAPLQNSTSATLCNIYLKNKSPSQN